MSDCTFGEISLYAEGGSIRLVLHDRLRSEMRMNEMARVCRLACPSEEPVRAIRLDRFLVVAFLAVAGCATPEHRAALDACTVEWNSRIPAVYEVRSMTRYRIEEVPDGTETCTREVVHDKSDPLRSSYVTRHTCTPNVKEVRVPYEVQQKIDIRADERSARIRDCAARRCLASHGNVACESNS